MKKVVLLTLAAALTAGTAQAGGKSGRPNNDYWKQLQVQEEFRRAREVGGYNDPFTALSNILAGRATSKDVTTGITTKYDLPEFGTVRLKGSWDR